MSGWAVHIYNRDGDSHGQHFVGPFRSHEIAEDFACRVNDRMRRTGSDDHGQCGAEAVVLGEPRMRDIAAEGWFDGPSVPEWEPEE